MGSGLSLPIGFGCVLPHLQNGDDNVDPLCKVPQLEELQERAGDAACWPSLNATQLGSAAAGMHGREDVPWGNVSGSGPHLLLISVNPTVRVLVM